MVLRLLFQLCPDAAPDSQPQPAKDCSFEGLFAHAPRPQKEDSSARLFHRVGELLLEAQGKFAELAASGKLPVSGLPAHRKK